MKTKKLFIALPVFVTALGLIGCGGGDNSGSGGGGHSYKDIDTYELPEAPDGSGTITVWVGKESVEFYQTAANEWVAAMKASNSKFNFAVTVEDHDSGGIAGSMELDNTTCADIVTAAHDNIGKLAQEKLVKPFNMKSLYTQVEEDNPATFFEVSHSVVDNVRAIYGSPYIAQSLFLMYDKRYVTAEQAKTFEGLKEAAAARSTSKLEVKAVTVTGQDGFNFSFPLLAQNNETHATTMKIYKDGDKKDCWAQGEDSVANLQWARRYFAEPNGLTWPSSSGWEIDLQNGGVVSIIGGAWKYKAFASAIGATNVGVSMIPTYTLTEADVAGTTQTAGTVMRGGTFADCKCLLINAASEPSKYVAEQSLVKFLSTKAIQNRSLIACDNLPAYAGASDYIESIKDELGEQKYSLALAQNKMAAYGIAQPFINGTLNSYFYSKGAPTLYTMVVENTDGKYGTTKAAREILYRMQHIWEKGKDPETAVPSSLPKDI